MKRHNARIIAVMTLYNMDVSLNSIDKLEDTFNSIVEIEKQEEYPVEIDFEYAYKLAKGVMDNITVIDKNISDALVGYTIDRLSYVDRAIIRECVYEMLYEKLAKNIAINEAIEITKDYSSLDDAQVKFNNAVLDNIAKVIYE